MRDSIEPNPRELDSFIMPEEGQPVNLPACRRCGSQAIIPVPIIRLMTEQEDGSYILPIFLCCTNCGLQVEHDMPVRGVQRLEEGAVQDGR
jgi:hypothetical protein